MMMIKDELGFFQTENGTVSDRRKPLCLALKIKITFYYLSNCQRLFAYILN